MRLRLLHSIPWMPLDWVTGCRCYPRSSWKNFGARKNAIGYSLVSRREILAYAETI